MSGSHTFSVDPVAPNNSSFRSSQTIKNILRGRGLRGVEGSGSNTDNPMFDPSMNPFLGAVHYAYGEHFRLTLAPDDVWTLIAQGFATHVVENAEALRGQFVSHEGTEEILVEILHKKGDPNLPWGGILASFSGGIAQHIGEKKRNLMVSDFSTTGPVERAVSEVVLMGAMSKYFSYHGRTLCGIPEITLLGTPADWQSVRDRASALSEYDLGWWTEHLLPILDQFVRASKKDVDTEFWKGMYKQKNESGGPYFGGWVVDLFPYFTHGWSGREYVNNALRNPRLGNRKPSVTSDAFPLGLTKVPWKWNYLGTVFDMEFYGGFMGVSQDPTTYALRPTLGWAVANAPEQTPTK